MAHPYWLCYSRRRLCSRLSLCPCQLGSLPMNNSVRVAIMARISSSRQDISRQLFDLHAFAKSKEWDVVEVCQETCSGNRDIKDRKSFKRILDLAADGKIDKVMVHEVSRIARRPSSVMMFVESLEEFNVSLYWHTQGVETLLPSGRRNPHTSMMLTMLAELARNESETQSIRINSGLAEARRKGTKLGRPEGSGYNSARLLAEHADIVYALKNGGSVRGSAKITGKNASTVQRVKKVLVYETRET